MTVLMTKGRGDPAGAEGEQQVDSLAGAAVVKLRLGGAHRVPGVEGLAEDRVDRLGERGAGLVRGDIEQADRVTRQDPIGVAGDGGVVVLPADAADPQAGDLVAAQSGEQPGQCDRVDEFERVEVPGLCLGEIGLLEVQSRPEQLRPDVVGDYPGVRAEQRGDAAWSGQCTPRIEASR
ncbi:hypothetical protein [Rhodococcus opacus]|uniref:hypothetical protein n=1 Tax=Rhodococcus opacus TaxID=37919 RepID=UPI00223549BD|nr:hypothetical protein [Rhodococcus opacus]UZG60300.1 hypothetical protein ONE62_42280 [Rhodococcus opacus]